MTEPGDVLFEILSNDAGVTALVSTNIYPAPAKQGVAPPFIAYAIIGNRPHDTKDGVSDLDEFLIQVDCWDDNARGAATLAAATRTALDRYTPGTVASITLDGLRYEDYGTDYDTDNDLNRARVDYTMRIKY